jgi:cation transport ATPase
LRLSSPFRFAVYAAFAALLLTGAAWLVADAWKDPEGSEIWQAIAANLLMLHGGAAMLTLMFLGALIPLHARRNWRIRSNRPTGTLMLACNAILVVTAFGLYYVGWDAVRWWVSEIHTAAGFFLPALFLVHVALGRRSADASRDRAAGLAQRQGLDGSADRTSTYAGSGSGAPRRVPK